MTAPAAVRQHVEVKDGFAYGVVGADVHVFADGVPVYLLENVRQPLRPDGRWLRQVPSRMLAARFALVPFTGREPELAWFEDWCGAEPRWSAEWIHAPGGAGKTRFADEAASRARAAGWKTVRAGYGPGAVLPPPGSQDLRPDGAAGLLLIVDYADRWPRSRLFLLMRNSLLTRPGVRTRIIFLARSAETWPLVREELADLGCVPHATAFAPLPGGSGAEARRTMYHAARAAYAAVHEPADSAPYEQTHSAPHESTAPADGSAAPDLDHPDFDLTLAVHMAALAAVDAAAFGRSAPQNVHGLTAYLLDREHEHWARLHGDGAAHPGGTAIATPPELMRRAVFAAVLTGAVDRAAGREIAVLLGPDATTAVDDHAICYPPADPDRDTVFEPLAPDRLAEDFLALTVVGRGADYPRAAWAVELAAQLMRRDPAGRAPDWTARAIAFLAAAAQRWPEFGGACLYPILDQDPDLGLAAGSAALGALARTVGHDHAAEADALRVMNRVYAALPWAWDADLDAGAADLAERLAAQFLDLDGGQDGTQRPGPAPDAGGSPEAADPDEAYWLEQLSWRHAAVGRAQLAADEALALAGRWRPTAGDDRYRPRLQHALAIAAARLGEAGRSGEAVPLAREARDLASAGSADSPVVLALAHHNLSMRLREIGAYQEAWEAAVAAIAFWSDTAAAAQTVEGADTEEADSFAATMNNLAGVLDELGRTPDAVEMAQGVVDIRRRQVAARPGPRRSALALALRNLALYLEEVGRLDEALAAGREAVELQRELVEANPDGHLPGLAAALTTLSTVSASAASLTGPTADEAWAAAAESVELRQTLARTDPAGRRGELASALHTLAGRAYESGRGDTAAVASGEAVAMLRDLADAHPAVYLPRLVTVLSGYARILADGALPDALHAADEAVRFAADLERDQPERYGATLADALSARAGILNRLDRPRDAHADLTRAVEILRRLNAARLPAGLREAVATGRRTFVPRHPGARADLARYLINLAVIRGAMGRPAYGAVPLTEAVGILRELAGEYPDAYLRDLARALSDLGELIGRGPFGGRRALGLSEEAVAILRRIAADDPEAGGPDLGWALNNLATRLSARRRDREALAAVTEAAGILEPLAARDPEAHGPTAALAAENLVKATAAVRRRGAR